MPRVTIFVMLMNVIFKNLKQIYNEKQNINNKELKCFIYVYLTAH